LLAPLQALTAARDYDLNGNAQTIDVQAFVPDLGASALVFAPWALLALGRLAAGIELDVTVGYGDAAIDVPEPLRQAIRLLTAHRQHHPVRRPPQHCARFHQCRRDRPGRFLCQHAGIRQWLGPPRRRGEIGSSCHGGKSAASGRDRRAHFQTRAGAGSKGREARLGRRCGRRRRCRRAAGAPGGPINLDRGVRAGVALGTAAGVWLFWHARQQKQQEKPA